METNEIVIMCQIATVVIMTISMVAAIISLVCSQKALSKELKEANKRMMTQLEHNQDLQTKQAQESFFAEYTRRYQDIILHMPDNDKDPRWLKYVQLYFDLCSEEYHLHEEGVINNRVWKLWVEGMQDTMKREVFRNAWKGELGQYYSDNKFVNFMHHDVMKA